MKNLKEFLNESYSSFSNWDDVEEALENFIEASNLEKFCDNADDNDIDEILSSFEEWLVEIYDVQKNVAKRTLKKFDSDIRKWFFDEGIVDTA